MGHVEFKLYEYFKVIMTMRKCNILRTTELSRYFGDILWVHYFGATGWEVFSKVALRICVFSEKLCVLKIIVKV